MTTYRIGQRVRVTWARTTYGKPFVGREGRINEIYALPFGDVLYGLDIDPITLVEVVEGRIVQGWAHPQLEPILPDGAQPSQYHTLVDLLTSLEGVPA